MNKNDHSDKRICERCGLIIADETWFCPLCKGALVTNRVIEAQNARSLAYPDVSVQIKKMKLVVKIAVFSSAVISAILILINYLAFQGVYWCLIAIAAMVYGCITLIASFRVRKSAQWRIIFQFILGAALIYSIDQILGYSGWSIRFSFPIIILLADLVAAIIMIVNVNGWQTYIVTEIYAGILGISMFLLEIFGVWELSVLGIIAGAVSVLLPVATILFGHRMVHEEIRRRFRL